MFLLEAKQARFGKKASSNHQEASFQPHLQLPNLYLFLTRMLQQLPLNEHGHAHPERLSSINLPDWLPDGLNILIPGLQRFLHDNLLHSINVLTSLDLPDPYPRLPTVPLTDYVQSLNHFD